MSEKKLGKNITVDQLAEMVAKGFDSLEQKMVTKAELDEILNQKLDQKLDEKLASIHQKLDDSIASHGQRIAKLEGKVVILKDVIESGLEVRVVW